MHSNRLILGSNFYPAAGDDARRQQAAQNSWRNLPNVDLINVQFACAPWQPYLPGFRSVPKLRCEAAQLTGISGKRKPVVSEMFDILAREAISAGHRLFAFSNTDILISTAAIATAIEGATRGYQAQIFSRMDFDGQSGEELEMITSGQDVFVVDANWWMENRWRFRPYVIGDIGWDNVYTSILFCHATSRLYNRTAFVRHERHPIQWLDSPYAAHNGFLKTLDSLYFSKWCDYWGCLVELRRAGAGEEREFALQGVSFSWHPPIRARVKHFGRSVRAFGRRWLCDSARGRLQIPPHRSAYW